MSELLSVNIAVPQPNPAKDVGTTGIDRRPVTGAVRVRAPGPKGSGLGSGLVGDKIFDVAHHGGNDQAIYAYAREDLDAWEFDLGRELRNGVFGENLTTAGVDLTNAVIGERWRVGPEVVLEVSGPRKPCGTFAHWMGEAGWVKRFISREIPGAFLRVIVPGEVSAGDSVTVQSQPGHGVTIALTFRALLVDQDLLPKLLVATELPESIIELATRRAARTGRT